ncbi:MAG: glycosyltransferase family 39 protein [Spirochaetaceae bacterium]|jgi:hypothetical protein|nr:glycosyltransferase family 39 protein [Spirochaetaceae bacterium]
MINLNDRIIPWIKKNDAQVLWAAVLLLAPILTLIGLTHESYWADEGFSVAMAGNSLRDIWHLGAEDFSPPLYYLALRVFTQIFGTSRWMFRFFSVLAIWATAIGLGLGPVRRIMGPTKAALYALLLLTAPYIISYAQEVRTYGWAMFALGGTAFWGYLYMKDGKIKDLILTTICAILSIYLHYFSAMGAFFIYLYIGIRLLFSKQPKKKVIYLILSGIMVLISFIPWISVFFDRVSAHSQGFWIPEPTMVTLVECLSLPYKLKFNSSAYAPFLTVFAYVLMAIGFYRNRKEKSGEIIFLTLFLMCAVTLTAYFYSIKVQPMLIDRYMLPLYAPFFAALALGIGSLKKNKFRFGMPAIFLLFCLPALLGIYTLRFSGPSDEIVQYIRDNGSDDDVVVHFGELTLSPIAVLLPEKQHVVYLAEDSQSNFNYKAYGEKVVVTHNIQQYLEGKEHIWLVSRERSVNHQAYVETMEDLGFTPSIIYTRHTSDHARVFRVSQSWLVLNLERMEYGEVIPIEETKE